MKIEIKTYERENYLSYDQSTRQTLINELIFSDHEEKSYLLKQLYLTEPNFQIKSQIRHGLDKANAAKITTALPASDSKQRIKNALLSSDEKLRHRAMIFLVDNKRVDFLEMTRALEKEINDPYLEATNIKLLALNPVQNLQEILSYLDSKDKRVINATLEILGQIGTTAAIATLIQLMSHHNRFIQKSSAILVSRVKPEQLRHVVAKMVTSEHVQYRISAAQMLGLLEIHKRSEMLETLMHDPDERVCSMAEKTNQRIINGQASREITLPPTSPSTSKESRSLEEIKHDLKSENDPKTIATILRQLNKAEGSIEEKIALLKTYMGNADARVRANALECLIGFYQREQLHSFLPYLKDPNHRVIGNTIVALCEPEHCPDEFYEQVEQALNRLIDNHAQRGCLTAIYCMDLCRDRRFLPILQKLRNSNFSEIAEKALAALKTWAPPSDVDLEIKEEEKLDDEHAIQSATILPETTLRAQENSKTLFIPCERCGFLNLPNSHTCSQCATLLGADTPSSARESAALNTTQDSTNDVPSSQEEDRSKAQKSKPKINKETLDKDLNSEQSSKAKTSDYVYAGFFIRLCAWLIDTLIIMVTALILSIIFGIWLISWMSKIGLGELYASISNLVGQILGYAVAIGYYLIFESSKEHRATPGKIICGLQLMDEDGECLSVKKSLIRYFHKILSMLTIVGYLMIMWRAKKQGLHDILSKTYVIEAKKPVLPKWLIITGTLLCCFIFLSLMVFAIAAPNLRIARELSNLRACYANQKMIFGAVKMYHLDTGEKKVIESRADLEVLVTARYLQALPMDPGRREKPNSYQSDEVGNVWCEHHGPINKCTPSRSRRCESAWERTTGVRVRRF